MELPKQYIPGEVEEKWRKSWLGQELYRWDPSRPREETFVVDTPPPTVSGHLHMGHVFSYTHQDLVVRHRRMKGMNIFYPMGWDDNGLPTERRVQNLLNVRCDPYVPYVAQFSPKASKKDAPEIVSRQNFIELCQQVTGNDEEAFKALFQRLGLSIDWNLEYATINDHCRKTSQLSFLKMLEAGVAYSVHAPTQWDVDFQSAVAQAELEDREVDGNFHNIRFGVEGGGSFVIATTRPELLAACVAVVAHPDDERYKPLFGRSAVTPLYRVRVPIIADSRADMAKGTGILMVCTFGDNTDVEWWKQYKLPLRQVVGRNGRLMTLHFGAEGWESLNAEAANVFYGAIAGKNVRQAKATVVEQLRAEGAESLPGLGCPLTEEPRPVKQAVKFYEKGERPLEIIPTRQWFIRLLGAREELIEQGRKIEWHPPYMRARYENWVNGLNSDWCISRQRYFGVPFPVWYPLDEEGNPCYDRPIVPTVQALPVDPLAQPAPGYDETQRGKPNGFMGDPDVMDTWATSSLTPQVNSHWAVDEARHGRLFPLDMRPQAHEIIRTWAFYTITKAWYHHRDIPWKHVVISGWVLDPNREKMSKSKGNVVTPDSLMAKYSSDAIRYWTARARLGVDTAYDENVFNNGKRLTTKLFNAARFVLGIFRESDPQVFSPKDITDPLDRCFLGRLRETVAKVSTSFEQFEFGNALAAVEEFFWGTFCDNYLEIAKRRAYMEEQNPARLSALASLKLALSVLLRLFAPIIPYLTEEVWSWGFAGLGGASQSIHGAPWPSDADFEGLESSPVDVFGASVGVLERVRKVKGDARVSMKAPLETILVRGEKDIIDGIRSCEADILAVCAAHSLQATVVEGQSELQVDAVLSPAAEVQS